VNANDYYKFWTMIGQNELYKLQTWTNYEKPSNPGNLFLYRYSHSYAEGLLGKFRHLTKFFGP
jgi:hypothetical protein